MNHTAAFVLSAAIAAVAWGAQPAKEGAPAPEPVAILKDRPDATAPRQGLGQAFESKAGGIALRPPAGCKEIHRATPDDIVEFTNDEKSWSLKVTRTTLSRALPLTEYFDNGRKLPGVLEMTADNFKRDNPSAEIVRQDVIDLGTNKVGMLASRVTLGNNRRLLQQAIIQSTDKRYYVLLFNSPAAKTPDPANPDPREQEAVATFTNVLDTVTLLDRSTIRDDQDQRLFRTRAFFVNLNETRVRQALIAEQWLRLQRDGKDIGYSYVVEETKRKGEPDGIHIGVRSRTMPEKGFQVDAETWMYASPDRRHEKWSNVAAIGDGTATKDFSSEVGYSDVEVSRRVNKAAAIPGQKAPPIDVEETHNLTVTKSSKSSTAQPVTRPLPPWYLPQAFGHLLPRLLPTDQARTYMFAAYVTDTGEVMNRYIDIGRPQEVTLGGKAFSAIPIKDRIGIEGSVTTHYISAADGRFLGSVNADSKITILASDRQTLLKLWSNANLTRPADPPARSDNAASRNDATSGR